MIPISLTDFVDFINSSGTSKMTKVREIVERDDYHPCKDYYKDARDVVVENRRAAGNIDELLEIIGAPRIESKRANYASVLNGVHRFCKKARRQAWFEPGEGMWTHEELEIRVNPELGLRIDGVPHTIKMYFKDEALMPRHAAVINHLMRRSIDHDQSMRFAVLDARRGTLLSKQFKVDMDGLLAGEAASFQTMWRRCKAA